MNEKSDEELTHYKNGRCQGKIRCIKMPSEYWRWEFRTEHDTPNMQHYVPGQIAWACGFSKTKELAIQHSHDALNFSLKEHDKSIR